jgi:hypothetical protein
MAHWLDDAATGLSAGRYNRRQILRRGGRRHGQRRGAGLGHLANHRRRAGLCCTGNCTGPAAAGISCCPKCGSTADAAACAGTGYSGMGGCRGGKLACICDNGTFCPSATGCCDIFCACHDPCPAASARPQVSSFVGLQLARY